MRQITLSCGPYAAASATALRAAAPIAAPGALTLSATSFTAPRRILFTFAGDASAAVFTVTGTDWNGQLVTEDVAGTNGGTVYTIYDYKGSITASSSAAVASNVSIGTNGIASSRPAFLDVYANGDTYVQATPSSSGISYTIQLAGDDPSRGVAYTAVNWINSGTSALVAATTAQTAVQNGVPTMMRVLINNAGSDTAATVSVNLNQSGMVAP